MFPASDGSCGLHTTAKGRSGVTFGKYVARDLPQPVVEVKKLPVTKRIVRFRDGA